MQALAVIPAALCVLVVFLDVAVLSTEETASQLELSPGAVKVRLHRARLRLRESLTAYLAAHTEAMDEPSS